MCDKLLMLKFNQDVETYTNLSLWHTGEKASLYGHNPEYPV